MRLLLAELSRPRVTHNDCGFNLSMQHLDSNRRAEDVAYEVPDEDSVHRGRQGVDVGTLASGESLSAIARTAASGPKEDPGCVFESPSIIMPAEVRAWRFEVAVCAAV
jgi:hypothetical protein